MNMATKDCHENTRICALTRKKDKRNTSGFKGVYWISKQNKWRATITFQGKFIHLGLFDKDKKEEAIKARKEAEEKYFNPIIYKYKNGGQANERI